MGIYAASVLPCSECIRESDHREEGKKGVKGRGTRETGEQSRRTATGSATRDLDKLPS